MNVAITILLASSLLDIGGGGADHVGARYLDEVDFSTPSQASMDLSAAEADRLAFYETSLSEEDAYAWFLGEDNRAWGLTDVEEAFEKTYVGYSVNPDEGVTVYLTSKVKAGGVPRLLEDYGVDAQVAIVTDDIDLDQVAFDFILAYGSDDYRSVKPTEDGTGLVVTVADERATTDGPLEIGTAFAGVPLTFEVTPPLPAQLRH